MNIIQPFPGYSAITILHVQVLASCAYYNVKIYIKVIQNSVCDFNESLPPPRKVQSKKFETVIIAVQSSDVCRVFAVCV